MISGESINSRLSFECSNNCFRDVVSIGDMLRHSEALDCDKAGDAFTVKYVYIEQKEGFLELSTTCDKEEGGNSRLKKAGKVFIENPGKQYHLKY